LKKAGIQNYAYHNFTEKKCEIIFQRVEMCELSENA